MARVAVDALPDAASRPSFSALLRAAGGAASWASSGLHLLALRLDILLLAAISGWISRRYGVAVAEDRLMVLNGTREGLFNAALALCPETKAGQQLVVTYPGGTRNILVPPGVKVTAYDLKDRATLKPGDWVGAVTRRGPDDVGQVLREADLIDQPGRARRDVRVEGALLLVVGAATGALARARFEVGEVLDDPGEVTRGAFWKFEADGVRETTGC